MFKRSSIQKLVLRTKQISDYHIQDELYSGYMFLFGGSSPLWIVGDNLSGCGIFAGGCNVFRLINNGKRPYAEFVGSRTIIGYILPLLD